MTMKSGISFSTLTVPCPYYHWVTMVCSGKYNYEQISFNNISRTFTLSPWWGTAQYTGSHLPDLCNSIPWRIHSKSSCKLCSLRLFFMRKFPSLLYCLIELWIFSGTYVYISFTVISYKKFFSKGVVTNNHSLAIIFS